MKITQLLTMTGMLLLYPAALFANGSAWRTGVPGTGSVASPKDIRATDVTIDDEQLIIDLQQGHTAVEVRYKMRNTGKKVTQDFFFPVERWSEDLEKYQISVDGNEIPWEDSPKLVVPGERDSFRNSPPVRAWKKSRVFFESGQTHEVVVRYHYPYAQESSSVSDDERIGASIFSYSLSPAATWKDPIRKGKVVVNVLHPEPEDVRIAKPKNSFKKINDTRYEWSFADLKPTLADDISIVAHSGYGEFPASYATPGKSGTYIIRGKHYYFQHANYDVVASSTLKAAGDHDYAAANLKKNYNDGAWVEGVEGDGIGESLTLTVQRPLPLDAIIVTPGFRDREHKDLWLKNNRVAAFVVTLNDEHTFTAVIPDEEKELQYPIIVRGYSKPVKTIKMVIKAVHPGTEYRDTCISSIELRTRLTKEPKIRGAR